MKRTRLDMHSRQEIVKANYHAYERAAKKGRKDILDRLEPVTGMNRSYLATVLGNYGRKADGGGTERKGRRKERPEGKRGGRLREYREEFTAVRMTIAMVVTLPVLFVYPFFQRYFLKGIMLGAIKG
jgi:hypothetical protein